MRTVQRLIRLTMQERDDVRELVVLQGGEAGHALIRPSVPNHRTKQAAVVVVIDYRRSNQIRRARTGGILAVTETAASFEERMSSLDCRRIGRRNLFRTLCRTGIMSLRKRHKSSGNQQRNQAQRWTKASYHVINISQPGFAALVSRAVSAKRLRVLSLGDVGVLVASDAPPYRSKNVGFTSILNNPIDVAALIDHTLLKPEAAATDVAKLCGEAREWKFASVCINPCWVPFAVAQIGGTSVKVCTVIGFPLGANTTRVKIVEAETALNDGALEIDMVQNIGALKSGNLDLARNEMRDLAALAHSRGALLKVILETCLLSDAQKLTACRLAVEAAVDFVKTSTGFSTGGATVADVELMRQAVGPIIGVKASGGVRTLQAVAQMVAAGATRIGTSSGVNIIQEIVAAGIPSDSQSQTKADY
jgi:deoxyribose-phosphate aldolase